MKDAKDWIPLIAAIVTAIIGPTLIEKFKVIFARVPPAEDDDTRMRREYREELALKKKELAQAEAERDAAEDALRQEREKSAIYRIILREHNLLPKADDVVTISRGGRLPENYDS